MVSLKNLHRAVRRKGLGSLCGRRLRGDKGCAFVGLGV